MNFKQKRKLDHQARMLKKLLAKKCAKRIIPHIAQTTTPILKNFAKKCCPTCKHSSEEGLCYEGDGVSEVSMDYICEKWEGIKMTEFKPSTPDDIKTSLVGEGIEAPILSMTTKNYKELGKTLGSEPTPTPKEK